MPLTFINEREVNIGSGNGMVASSNTPLPKQMPTQIYVTIWHQYATMK